MKGTQPAIVGFKDGGRRSHAQEGGWPPAAGNGKKTVSPGACGPANTLILAQLDLYQISDLWNWKIINPCCFQILHLWEFVTAAIEY